MIHAGSPEHEDAMFNGHPARAFGGETKT